MQYYGHTSTPLPLQKTLYQHYQAIQAHSASSDGAPPLYLPYSFYKVICQHHQTHPMLSQNALSKYPSSRNMLSANWIQVFQIFCIVLCLISILCSLFDLFLLLSFFISLFFLITFFPTDSNCSLFLCCQVAQQDHSIREHNC